MKKILIATLLLFLLIAIGCKFRYYDGFEMIDAIESKYPKDPNGEVSVDRIDDIILDYAALRENISMIEDNRDAIAVLLFIDFKINLLHTQKELSFIQNYDFSNTDCDTKEEFMKLNTHVDDGVLYANLAKNNLTLIQRYYPQITKKIGENELDDIDENLDIVIISIPDRFREIKEIMEEKC